MHEFLEQYVSHSSAFFSSGKYVTAIGIERAPPLMPSLI
jgi:hypothetical protein